jgi:predicted nucleic acid-binding protein
MYRAEAIALALGISADLILLDVRDGRVASELVGLWVTGVLGVLLRAKKESQIHSVKQEFDSLHSRARFLSPHLDRTILELAGDWTYGGLRLIRQPQFSKRSRTTFGRASEPR